MHDNFFFSLLPLLNDLSFCFIHKQQFNRFWKTKPNIRVLKIADEKTTFSIVSDILKERGIEYPNDSEKRDALSVISKSKNLMKKVSEQTEYEQFLSTRYQDKLREQRLMDYDDQIRYALKLLTEPPQPTFGISAPLSIYMR